MIKNKMMKYFALEAKMKTTPDKKKDSSVLIFKYNRLKTAKAEAADVTLFKKDPSRGE